MDPRRRETGTWWNPTQSWRLRRYSETKNVKILRSVKMWSKRTYDWRSGNRVVKIDYISFEPHTNWVRSHVLFKNLEKTLQTIFRINLSSTIHTFVVRLPHQYCFPTSKLLLFWMSSFIIYQILPSNFKLSITKNHFLTCLNTKVSLNLWFFLLNWTISVISS